MEVLTPSDTGAQSVERIGDDALPRDLAGLDLTRAVLPDHLNLNESIRGLDEAVKNVGKYYIALLGASAYLMLTLATTKDSILVGGTTAMILPIVQTGVPVPGFFGGAPFVLLAAYVYFHLEMLSIWDRVGTFPAILPDGRRLSEFLYPWFPLSIAERYFSKLQPRSAAIDAVKHSLVVFLLWWLTPIAILLTMVRYLRTRDYFVINCQLVALLAAILFGLVFYRMSRQRLTRNVPNPSAKIWPIVCFLSVLAALSGASTVGIRRLVARHSSYGQNDPRTKPIPIVGFAAFTTLQVSNQELAPRPTSWAGRDQDYDIVRGPVLEKLDLRYIQAYRTFGAGTSFAHSNLLGANFISADLTRANFEFSNLQSAFLDSGKLRRAHLRRANLRWTSMSGADLGGANLRGARLHYTNLKRANLQQADISYVDGFDADFSGADLRGVKMINGLLYGCLFKGADLRGVTLNGGLDGIDISGARLEGTRFGEFSLTRSIRACYTDFSKAAPLFGRYPYFPESNFAGSIFKGLNLREAGIFSCVFDLCDLRNVDLTFARMDDSQFMGSNLSKAILTEVDLSGGVFVGSKLVGANLRKCNLRGASFRFCDLRGVDLRDATINTVFYKCDLREADLRFTGLSKKNFIECNTSGTLMNLSRGTGWSGTR